MKTTFALHHHPFSTPVALLLFSVLALLPATLTFARLTGLGAMFAAIGPMVAAMWLAATMAGTRLQLVSWSTVLSALLLAVNWIITAGPGCCKTVEPQ